MAAHSHRRNLNAGYSLVELLVAVAIFACLAAGAVLTSSAAIQAARSDGALNNVVKELRDARELAIAERRNIVVRFIAPNQVEVSRYNVVGTTEDRAHPEVLQTVTLEGRLQFLLPAGGVTRPENFGDPNPVAGALDFGGATALIFTSEGSFVDQTGDPLDGTVFMHDPNVANSLRAVTIFGPTALVRAWRWNGSTWNE
jgi:prepilin-type N-terminal cleavage/methylation domain-containing protein